MLCTRCKIDKDISDFRTYKSNGAIVRQKQCANCKDATAAAYRKRHPERINEFNKKYRLRRVGRLKEAGLCIYGEWCGKPAFPGYSYCWDCTITTRLQQLDVLPEEKEKVRARAQYFDGHCDICGQYCIDKKDWCIDHCHETKRFRGFLCRMCNFCIGSGKDDVNILTNAITYLNKSVAT